MSIKNMPRLPRPAATGVLHQRRYIGSVYTSDQIRARDIKVWNMAIEAASKACIETGAIKGSSDSTFDMADDCANAILKLKE
jgi:hypothetical protein